MSMRRAVIINYSLILVHTMEVGNVILLSTQGLPRSNNKVFLAYSLVKRAQN